MNDKDDEQWLSALAGKPDSSADSATNAQAQALRAAMLARREALEHATQNADPAEFERLKARLEREGLLAQAKPSAKQAHGKGFAAWLAQWLPSKGSGLSALPIWSLSANVVLVTVVVVQLVLNLSTTPDEVDVLRSGRGTVLLGPNPQMRLAELTSGLDAVKARYVVMQKPNGELRLLVQADDKALDYLALQRIEPTVTDGVVVIGLRSTEQPQK